MGMSIDKAILRIEHSWMSDDDKETADFIINTMCKYQKIKQILDDWESSGEEDDPINIIDNIGEVIEDGKID